MDTQALEDRVQKIEEKLRAQEERLAARYPAIRQRRQRRGFLRRWQKSFLKRAIPLAVSYIAIGFFLQALQTPEPWLRALTPVLTITVFTAVTPIVKYWWFDREKSKSDPDRETDL